MNRPSGSRRLWLSVGAAAVSCVLVGCSHADISTPTTAPVRTERPPSTAAVPPAKTPVPPPTPGSTASTVKPQKITKRKPVKLSATGTTADKVTVALTSIKAIKAIARGPGEVTGPGLAITVSVKNATGSAFGLTTSVVNLSDAKSEPTVGMTGKPAAQLPTSVGAGMTVKGVYVFAVATNRRNPVTVEVNLDPRAPTVVFRGKAP